MNHYRLTEEARPGTLVTYSLDPGDTTETGIVVGNPVEDPYGRMYVPVSIGDRVVVVDAPSILHVTKP